MEIYLKVSILIFVVLIYILSTIAVTGFMQFCIWKFSFRKAIIRSLAYYAKDETHRLLSWNDIIQFSQYTPVKCPKYIDLVEEVEKLRSKAIQGLVPYSQSTELLENLLIEAYNFKRLDGLPEGMKSNINILQETENMNQIAFENLLSQIKELNTINLKEYHRQKVINVLSLLIGAVGLSPLAISSYEYIWKSLGS